MKTIGVVGSRRRHSPRDYQLVKSAVLAELEDGDKLVSGGCPKGADLFAEVIARETGAEIVVHAAQWAKYGRSAGFRQNGLIAADADVLIACVAKDRTGGTEDTIRKFRMCHPEGKLVLV